MTSRIRYIYEAPVTRVYERVEQRYVGKYPNGEAIFEAVHLGWVVVVDNISHFVGKERPSVAIGAPARIILELSLFEGVPE